MYWRNYLFSSPHTLKWQLMLPPVFLLYKKGNGAQTSKSISFDPMVKWKVGFQSRHCVVRACVFRSHCLGAQAIL